MIHNPSLHDPGIGKSSILAPSSSGSLASSSKNHPRDRPQESHWVSKNHSFSTILQCSSPSTIAQKSPAKGSDGSENQKIQSSGRGPYVILSSLILKSAEGRVRSYKSLF